MTGPAERISTETSPLLAEHQARYEYAKRWVRCKRVLDVACGSGVGLQLLVEGGAAEVVGCDVDEIAVRSAASAFGRATLVRADAVALPFPDESFDVVVSFETLEHLKDGPLFVAELRRVLHRDGTLILSTPNAIHTKPPKGVPTNPFHTYEYAPDELRALLQSKFPNIAIVGQRVSRSYGSVPYWQDASERPRGIRSLIQSGLWKAVARAPAGWREALSSILLGRSFYPSRFDFDFVEDLWGTHGLVAVAAPPVHSTDYERIASLLECVECKGGILADSPDRLRCEKCSRVFPIIDGIPRMWKPEGGEARTAATFGFEFTRISGDQQSWQEIVDQFLERTGLQASRELLVAHVHQEVLRGQVWIDAGCGMGRYSRVARMLGAEVIAIDISDGILRARAESVGDPLLHVVQASLLNLPIKSGVIDGAFSIGVLHHTGQTFEAFRELTRTLKPGGSMAVWVYPHEYWNGPIRGFVTRSIRAVLLKLPTSATYAFCLIVFPLGRVQGLVSKLGSLRWLFAPLFLITVPRDPRRGVMISTIYDYYSPENVETYSPEDVETWFHRESYRRVTRLPLPSSARGER